MEEVQTRRTSAVKPLTRQIGLGISIGLFMFFWLSVTIAAFNAKGCRGADTPPETKLGYCERSEKYGGWMDVIPIERAKGSMLHLERGIALAALGVKNEAVSSFQRALNDAGATAGPWKDNLAARIAQENDIAVQQAWNKALKTR
jgi:hypothetical protein